MKAHSLIQAAQGGRVAHSGFLSPEEAGRLAVQVREAEVGVHLSGGFPGARRRVLTVFPAHIPEATTALAAVYIEGVDDDAALRAALLTHGIDETSLGDVVRQQTGLSVVMLEPDLTKALELKAIEGRPVNVQEVALERLASGKQVSRQVIVPALRVDTLGAKAFSVSRSYFSKGVAAGKVSVNGKQATKKINAEPGDEVYAEGLGRFFVRSVTGETRRGNLKVQLEIEKA